METLKEIFTQPIETSFVENESSKEYHSKKSILSSSGLKRFISSANEFLYWFCFVAEEEKETSTWNALKKGSLIHDVLLLNKPFLLEPDFGDLRSKDAREKRAAFLKNIPDGTACLPLKQLEMMATIQKNLSRNEFGKKLFQKSETSFFERSGYFKHELGFNCRIKPDIYLQDSKTLVELKTTTTVSDSVFSRQVHSLKYHVQLAFYAHGIKALYGDEVQNYFFVVCETEPPYEVVVYKADATVTEVGELIVNKTFKDFAQALDSNEWPMKNQGVVQTLALPHWALQDHLLQTETAFFDTDPEIFYV